jgi:NADPH-dependent 2,4-dienoyl-CoA reductase/sulfur reductase-like enzyme
MQQELTGPDLKSGIASSDLVDMLAGHADGEAVLLVRRDGKIHAIGGSCTHYGAPLADGLVVGDTIRCPWHHACFDLNSGEALRAPALMPVAVWDVEEQDGKIRVLGKRDQSARRSPLAARHSIGIVGAGAAGLAAADMLRRSGHTGSIAMFGPEAPVDRPNLSKDYLAGNAPEEWLPLPMPADVELMNRRVSALNAQTKTLTLDDGTICAFDRILLATGAEPVRLPIPGADQPHVHYLRTTNDSRAIIAAASKGKRAVIIGAGFIGLEVAAALRAREIDVTVVAPEDIPLARVMGDDVGRFIQRLHEEHGVRFLLGTGVKSIEANAVVTSKGESLPADFVIMGTGVRPNIALAEAAGLAVDNGIVVNECLETSVPGIYAAGDVARWPDRFSGRSIRVEHWVVAEQQAQVAARNIAGAKEPYTHAPFFWSAHYDVTIAYVGNAVGFDAVEVRGSLEDRHALIAYRTKGRVTAVASIFMDRESLAIEHAMEIGDDAEVERILATV